MTKLLPERTTTSCASLWRKLKTSTSLILMTASPGCRPACSDRLPALTCKTEEETGNEVTMCASKRESERETTLRSNRETIGNWQREVEFNLNSKRGLKGSKQAERQMNLLCAVCKNYEATTAQCTVGERGEEGERERERFPQYLNLNQSQIAATFSAAFFLA